MAFASERAGRFAFVAAFTLTLVGCATTPPLEMATGGVQPAEIVERVKCELAEAFGTKITQPKFRWMSTWTVKVDLTLQATAQLGIAPNFLYTKNFRNAYNVDAGPSTLNGASISAIPQIFTFGVNGGINEQAVRTEALSFSLSLREMKDWLDERRRRLGRGGGASCDPSGALELAGDLGLKEWVDSALAPVENGQLQAGVHPAPAVAGKGGGGSKGDKKKSDGEREVPRAAPSCPRPRHEAPGVAWQIRSMEEMLERNSQDIQGSSLVVSNIVSEIDRGRNILRSYDGVISDRNRVYIASQVRYLNGVIDSNKFIEFKEALNVNKILDGARNHQRNEGRLEEDCVKMHTITQKVKGFVSSKDRSCHSLGVLSDYIAGRGGPGEAPPEARLSLRDAAENCLDSVKARLAEVTKSLLNPPLDSLSHSVQFVVGFGAGASPSWALTPWKGPLAGGSNLLSATGGRTHILNIVVGSPDAGELTRMLGTLAIQQSRN